MLTEKIIPFSELKKFGSVENLNEQAKSLVLQQKANWELAAKNYDGLTRIQTRTFDFDHFNIVAQFNPERIRSSAAKTDAKSIAERTCFLCLNNLPKEQKGIVFEDQYLILSNPFPIFPAHLTISNLEHTPQRIPGFFGDMLTLSRELKDFTVFYNGPQTGASAPDHFHFQAGNKGLLPIETEFASLIKNHAEILFETSEIKVNAVNNYLRKFISIQSENPKEIEKVFNEISEILPSADDKEPMLNVLCNYKKGKWRVIVFPREKQRPSHYYKTGSEKIIVGPASVELGGVLILPREEDFIKIEKIILKEIYREITVADLSFTQICHKIRSLQTLT